jgi:hypothetical protein
MPVITTCTKLNRPSIHCKVPVPPSRPITSTTTNRHQPILPPDNTNKTPTTVNALKITIGGTPHGRDKNTQQIKQKQKKEDLDRHKRACHQDGANNPDFLKQREKLLAQIAALEQKYKNK